MHNEKGRKSGIENIEKRLSQTVLLVLLTFAAIFFFLFRETDLKSFIHRLNPFYLFLLFVLLFLVWLFDAMKFYLVVRLSGGKVSFIRSFEIVLASIFGSNITPFYSGGIPTQVYFLSKFAESVGKATAISVLYMILTLIVYLVFSVILLLTPHGFITGVRKDFFITLAFVVFAFSFFAFFFMRFPKKAKGIIHIISKKISPDKFDPGGLEKSIDDFSRGLSLFFSNDKLLALLSVVVAFIAQTLFLFLTPLSFKALNLPLSLKEILLSQIAMQFTTSIGATPGGIGIMDAAFAAFFKPFAPSSIAQLTLLYRLVSFYIPTLIGGLYFYKLMREKKKKKTIYK